MELLQTLYSRYQANTEKLDVDNGQSISSLLKVLQSYSQSEIEQALHLLLDQNTCLSDNEGADRRHDAYGSSDEQRLGCLSELLQAASKLPAPEDTPQETVLTVLFCGTVQWLCDLPEHYSNTFVESVITSWSLYLSDVPYKTLLHAFDKLLDAMTRAQPKPHICTTILITTLLSHLANPRETDESTATTKGRGLDGSSIDMMISRIITTQIQPDLIVPLATALHSATLTQDQITKLTESWIQRMNDVKSEELPTLVYQLALYAAKIPRVPILPNILAMFSQRDLVSTNDADEQLSLTQANIESTIIFHLCFTLGQDQKLCESFIKAVKAEHRHLMSSFTLTCLLTLAKNYRYEEQIQQFLESILVMSARDRLYLASAPWLKDCFELHPLPVFDLLHLVVARLRHGSDRALQPLIKLLVHVIDQYSAPVNENGGRVAKKDEFHALVIDHAVQLLVHIFEHCNSARISLLEIIFEHLVLRTKSAKIYVTVLELMAERNCAILLEYQTQLKELLSMLPTMEHTVAIQFIRAFKPLLDANRPLIDHAMLLVRKCLFLRDVTSRENALYALSTLATLPLTCLDESNQGQERIDAYRSEMIAMMVRSTYQNAYSRAVTYQYLNRLSMLMPEKILSLTNHFLAQAEEWIDGSSTRGSPIHLSLAVRCYSSANTPSQHTLPQLLLLLERCASLGGSSHPQTSEFLNQLVARLASVDLSEYDLARDAAVQDEKVEQQRLIKLNCLIEVYEVALTLVMQEPDLTTRIELMRSLFGKHCQAHNLLRDKTGTSTGCTCQLRDTVLANATAEKICDMLLDDSDTSLRFGYRIHVLRMLAAVAQRDVKSECGSPRLQGYIAQVLLKELKECATNEQRFSPGFPDAMVCISGLQTLVTALLEQSTSTDLAALETVLSHLNLSNANDEECSPSVAIITHLKIIFSAFLRRSTTLQKEAAAALSLMSQIYQALFKHQSDYLAEWLKEMATVRQIENVDLARIITNMLLATESGATELPIHQYIALDLRIICGSIGLPDEVIDIEEEMQFMIVGPKTTRIVVRTLLESIDASLEELNHCLSHWYASRQEGGQKGPAVAQSMSFVLNRMRSICQTCVSLERTCLVGSMAERLLSTLQRVYKLLGNITRKFSQLSIYPNEDFQSLINVVGGPLSHHLYLLIPYMQQYESENAASLEQSKKEKTRKDDAPPTKKARIHREQRAIPGLIFLVEQFEKHLITLSKQTKMDLVSRLKRSTARDFRIQINQLITSGSSSDDEQDPVETEDIHTTEEMAVSEADSDAASSSA